MKKIIVLVFTSLLVFSGCSTEYTSEDFNEENLVSIEDVYTNPDNNLGKSVEFYTHVFDVSDIEDGRLIQGYTNESYDDNDILIAISDDKNVGEINSGDYLFVQGVYVGNIEGENALGAESEWIQVNSTSETKISNYMEAVSPTVFELDIDKKDNQNDIITNVKKIEQSPVETRLYFTVDNQTEYIYSTYEFNYVLIVDGNQYDPQYNYEANYDDFQSDIQPGIEMDYMISYPYIDIENASSIKLNIESGYSENYDLDFEDISIVIK